MSNDWIEHTGGPQPVGDDVWVEIDEGRYWRTESAPAGGFKWTGKQFKFQILNQHLIDAKQAEIDALQHEVMWLHNALEQTEEAVVYGYTLLDDMDAKIDAARLEGIRLGLEAAATHLTEGGWVPEIMSLNPDTIARDVQTTSHQAKCDNLHIAREAVLIQLTREAQADNMGYDKETTR